jgi:hypothetical protein
MHAASGDIELNIVRLAIKQCRVRICINNRLTKRPCASANRWVYATIIASICDGIHLSDRMRGLNRLNN